MIIREKKSQNVSGKSVNPEVEDLFEGGSYFFSTAQEPQPDTSASVYHTNSRFTVAMLKDEKPTLIVYVGKYTNIGELMVENLLPFTFLYGRDGQKHPRSIKVSVEACVQRYMRLAMRQFMRRDVILVLHHIFSEQL